MEEKEKIKKQEKRNPNKIFIIAIAFLILIFGCKFIYDELGYVSTDDAYVETTTVQVSPKVSGQLVKVLVSDNQKVKKGDLIAVIEDNDYKIKLAQASAKYEQAIQNQKNAKANHESVQTQIATAKADYERYKHSYEAGAVSKQAYDAAKTKYDSVKATLTNSSEALITKDGKSVADAQIAELKALKNQAELYLSYTRIYAPQDGTIAGKKASVGMLVQPGTPLLTIVPHNVWVIANYKENQLEHIEIGQEVEIKVDAYPHQKFTGKIDSFQRASGAKSSMFPPENAVGSFVKIVQRIPVKIVFTDLTEEQMKKIIPGMSVEPKVNIRKAI
ncbi:MAG: HlyD family secretion protein [Candidatus Gastranaerophilales bacterium]|nr:HlyD family secretion protein [Candidatus Gastranaerophilales bacterium]